MESRRKKNLGIDALAIVMAVAVFWPLWGRMHEVRIPSHGDQAGYLENAANLGEGEGFIIKSLSPFYPTREITRPESIRQPLLPWLLSYRAGRDYGFFRRAQSMVWFIGLVCAIVLYLGATRVWGRPVALLGTTLVVLNVHFQTYATEIWCENLLILFTTASGLFIHQYFQSEKWIPSGSLLVAAGALTALAYYTKASALILFVAFCGFCIYRLIRAAGQRLSNLEINKRAVAPLFRFGLTFLFLLLPYVVINLVNTGTLLRNRDLRAAMWVAAPGEYYLPREVPPSASQLLRQEPLLYFVKRFAWGVYAQLGNYVDSLRIHPFETSYVVGAIILVVALGHLFIYRLRGWRGFLLAMLGINFVLAAWYVVIDTAPRFIFIGIPFLCFHFALALQSVLRVSLSRFAKDNGHTARLRQVMYTLAVLLVVFTFWQQSEHLSARATPIRLTQAEQKVIRFLQRETREDDVILWGPSHRLPWNYIIDRRNIFVPNYSSWEEVTEHYLDFFDARYFLMDWDIYVRRKHMFDSYIDWHEPGITLKEVPPRLKPVFVDEDVPPAFIVFEILPEQS